MADHYVLADDAPKENPWQEDRLGFAAFADRLSNIITDLNVPNGYVIGLHGQWGSGKTTVLNFIKAYLRKHNEETGEKEDKIEIVDFRPWIVAGHQDLIAAFFKVLAESLGPRDRWWKRKGKAAMRAVLGASDDLIDSTAKLAVIVDPTAGVASGAARQVKSIMQMVKTVGRLPNVVYLLAYDRAIVWKSLDDTVDRIGPRFAEKIVQQEVELPKPSKNAMLSILDREISFLTGPIESSARWEYLVRDGIRRWIKSPRDVIRLANALKFSWPALEGEIDRQDLLAMEGLRLFDEIAFDWVRDNRDFLFNQGRFMMADDEAKQAAIDSLIRRLNEATQSEVLQTLIVLFPSTEKWFKHRELMGGEPVAEIAARRGVGSEAGYDAYFGLHPSADEIPKSVIDGLFANLEDTDSIERLIRSYLGKQNSRGESMVGKLLDELEARFRSRSPAAPTQALLNALFRVGEEIIALDRPHEIFALAPRAQIALLGLSKPATIWLTRSKAQNPQLFAPTCM